MSRDHENNNLLVADQFEHWRCFFYCPTSICQRNG